MIIQNVENEHFGKPPGKDFLNSFQKIYHDSKIVLCRVLSPKRTKIAQNANIWSVKLLLLMYTTMVTKVAFENDERRKREYFTRASIHDWALPKDFEYPLFWNKGEALHFTVALKAFL